MGYSKFTGTSVTTLVANYNYFAIPTYYGDITEVYASSNPSTNLATSVTRIKTGFSYSVGSQNLTFDIYKFNNPGAIPLNQGLTVS